MKGLITLADLPALKGSDPKPSVKIAIGRLDSNLRDPRYGKFSIAQADVDSWKRNLAGVFGGQVSFDFDHSSDRGGGTKAALWITGIDQTGTKDGSLITADAQFTRAGARSVRSGEYKYTSPTFVENYTDEHGDKHGKTLIGGALTNRPVLRKGMPCLSLSRDSIEGVAVSDQTVRSAKRERKRARSELARLLASNTDAPRDSRAQMTPTRADLIKLLGLDEDADATAILTSVVTLAAAVPVSPSKTPGSSASSKGRKGADDRVAVAALGAKAAKKAKKLAKRQAAGKAMALSSILSPEETAKLITAANAGQAAAIQLSEQTFDVAWQKALSEGRAAPSQEENLKALHAVDPELAISTLDSFVPIVPVKPTGSGEAGAATQAPEGMDQERYALHTEAKALAATKMAADSNLAEADAYTLAAIEIEDKKFMLEHPGI